MCNENPYLNLTVDMLIDITESQLICFGDHILVTRPSLSHDGELIAFEANGNEFLVCSSPDAMRVTLKQLLQTLRELPSNANIETYYATPNEFQVGFIESVEGFVEIFNINELVGA
ncbi:hypothetical protein [Pseudoalteromonas prydzensis]|uniref:hypothetical protein n=1 Tax=Pseudoalteromonas prydzensis TaxID=182141 RepID=UPI003FD06CB0